MRAVPVVKAYWWKGAPNFGDALAPLLLQHFCGVKTEWRSPSRATVISVGSVLEHLSPAYDGYIVGSGKLHRSTKPKFPYATILALRGPLTARGVPGDYALGDPGLLADELVGPQKKEWDLGILPHWRDTELVARFTRLIRKGKLKVIKPSDDPLTVIRQIGACRRLVTSSLHGMIVADAFGGIPRRVEISPAIAKEGGDYKFLDYSASINTPFVPGKMTEPLRWHVEDTKYSIFDAYKILEKDLRP
jgi:hypothetical protein